MRERRSVVTPIVSVLRFFTFVVAANLLAEDLKHIQPPTCSFEVDGVEQPCAKFEAGKCVSLHCKGCNISDQRLEVVHDLEYIDFSRNNIDYLNITFYINFNDGMLLLYKTEDCWTFQLTENFATKNVSNVKLNFDFIPNNYMLHPGSIYHTGDECPLMHVVLEGRLLSVSREFTLQIHHSERIKTAEVTLMGAECYINCSGAINPCKVDRLDTIQLSDVNKQIVFKNLTYGHYYCIRVEESSDCPAIHTKTSQLKLVVSTVQPIVITPTASVNGAMILFIIALIGVISAKAIAMLKRGRENGHRMLVALDEEGQELWTFKMKEWQSLPPAPTVLLLYSRDSPDFCRVMEALRKLLEKCGNMKVLDPFNQSQREEVSQNISGWVMKHMSRADVKIIVVESEGSYIRQQALLNRKRALLVDSDCLDYVFTFALTLLHNDFGLRENYDRLFRIRFESITENQVMLKFIVPLKCYYLLQQLDTLIMGLKSFSSENRLTLEDIRLECPNELEDLEHSVSSMEAVLKNNPHHIQMHFMLSSS